MVVCATSQEMGWKRSDYVISTKIFWGGPGPNDKGLSRKHIVEGTRVLPSYLILHVLNYILCVKTYACLDRTSSAVWFAPKTYVKNPCTCKHVL